MTYSKMWTRLFKTGFSVEKLIIVIIAVMCGIASALFMYRYVDVTPATFEDYAVLNNRLEEIQGKPEEFFKENNFLIGVSLDGSQKTNDRYRLGKNGESVYKKVLDSISILKKHDVDFNILCVIDNENAKDTESTYKFFKEQEFYFLQFIPYVDEANGIALSAESYEYFLKKCFDLWYDDFTAGNYISIRHIDNYIGIILGNPPENCAMCGVCGSYFVLEANGDLYPCDFYCKEEYRLGNIADNTPFTASVKQKSFTEESHKIHSFCRSCEYYMLCRGGCKRDRYDGYTKNRYCKAYKVFFDYAAERMMLLARSLGNE